jgi:hypothetical protein
MLLKAKPTSAGENNIKPRENWLQGRREGGGEEGNRFVLSLPL